MKGCVAIALLAACVASAADAGVQLGSAELFSVKAVEPAGDGGASNPQATERMKQALTGYLKEVRFCYEKQLVYGAQPKGQMGVRITLAPTGAVKSTWVTYAAIPGLELQTCVLERANTWKFPELGAKSPTSFVVEYAFNPTADAGLVVPR